MTNKTAKLFVNGGSQAVRLSAEFRFDGLDEVSSVRWIERPQAGKPALVRVAAVRGVSTI